MPTNVLLHLQADDEGTIRQNLSAVVLAGRYAWLGTDEGTSLERLELEGDGYVNHVRFDLADYVKLPSDSAKDEVDVEGLAYEGNGLWVVGSHSAKRSKPKDSDGVEEIVAKLGEVKIEGNRFLLARIPLSEDGGAPGTGTILAGTDKGNELTEVLRNDVHLSSSLPRIVKGAKGVADPADDKGHGKKKNKSVVGGASKENGLDLEGLAAVGNRLFIGCRGPVLRGWAVILDVDVAVPEDDDDRELHLKKPLRKHFVALDGLGIRDLVLDGADLLILAGPTMGLDGPTRVYRYRGATEATADSVARPEALLDVPHGLGTDHAEGMALVDLPLTGTEWKGRGILLVYDSPAAGRCEPNGKGVSADVIRLP